MKNSQQALSSILKTTQMGQLGIRSVLESRMRPNLRQALEEQLKEYDRIETEAHTLACQRGWELPELDPAIRAMTNMVTRIKVNGSGTESRIADMMIQGNTKGMIQQTKNARRFPHADMPISALNQKLLDTENANIRQMIRFL